MSKTTVKIFQDDDYAYFKFPYSARFLELYRDYIPPRFRDTVQGTGWQAETKIWVFSLEVYETMERCIADCFNDEVYWRFVNTFEELIA